jgi:hypothetical protein
MTGIELPFDPATLEVPEELTLVVGWKRSDKFAGGEVRVAASVASHLRAACEETVKRVSTRERRLYTPDMHLEEEEVLVVTDPDQVADSPLAEIVLPTEPLPLINAQSLPRRGLQLYAAVIQTKDGDMAFVRKTNPRTPAKAGRMFALLGNTLARIGGPVFGLDDYFDMIVTERGIIALSQAYFELLFRDTPALQQRIPEWVDEINACIPLAGDGMSRLAERAGTDGRLRRRLRSIAEREHLSTVTLERIRQHLQEAGLAEERFLDGDCLRYDDANPFDLVYLLNEDFFQGGLTDAAFRSDRKSPR